MSMQKIIQRIRVNVKCTRTRNVRVNRLVSYPLRMAYSIYGQGLIAHMSPCYGQGLSAARGHATSNADSVDREM